MAAYEHTMWRTQMSVRACVCARACGHVCAHVISEIKHPFQDNAYSIIMHTLYMLEFV